MQEQTNKQEEFKWVLVVVWDGLTKDYLARYVTRKNKRKPARCSYHACLLVEYDNNFRIVTTKAIIIILSEIDMKIGIIFKKTCESYNSRFSLLACYEEAVLGKGKSRGKWAACFLLFYFHITHAGLRRMSLFLVERVKKRPCNAHNSFFLAQKNRP